MISTVHEHSTCRLAMVQNLYPGTVPPRHSLTELVSSSSGTGNPVAAPTSSQAHQLQPLPSSHPHPQPGSMSTAARQRPARPLSNSRLSSAAALANSLSIGRNIERVLEDCAHTGRLNLSGRGMKELSCPSPSKYNLIDTVTADVSRNRLSELPDSLLELVFLEFLDCRENLLKSLPNDIMRLRCLVHLDLSRNLLSSLPAVICKLPALEILLVSHNRLQSLPEEMGSLQSLMDLNVSCNQLTHLPASLSRLSALRSLDVRKNLLQALPNDVAKLRLIRLDVSQNLLTSLPSSLRSMTTLEYLHVLDNPLDCPSMQVCSRGQIHIFKCLETATHKGGPYLNGELRRSSRSENASRDRKELANRSVDREMSEYACPSSLIPVAVPINKHVLAADVRSSSMGGPKPSRPVANGVSAPPPPRSFSLELPSVESREDVAANGKEHPENSVGHATATRVACVDEPEAAHLDGVTAAVANGKLSEEASSLVMVDASPENGLPPAQVAAEDAGAAVNGGVLPLAASGDDHAVFKKPAAVSQIPRKISPGQTSSGRNIGKGGPKSVVASGRPRTGSGSGTVSSSNSSQGNGSAREAAHPDHKGLRSKEASLDDKSSSAVSTPQTYPSPVPEKEAAAGKTDQISPKGKAPAAPSKSARTMTKQKSAGSAAVNGAGDASAVSSARKASLPSGSSSTVAVAAAKSAVTAPEYNSNFTIRRQQEQMREENEKVQVLRKYLESRLKLRLPDDLLGALQDGVILCHLVNHIRPRSVISIHVPTQTQSASSSLSASATPPKLTPAKCRRNVDNFLDACRRLGLSEVILCSPADILEGKNVSRIVDCVQGVSLMESSGGSAVGGKRSASVQVASSFSLVYSSSALPPAATAAPSSAVAGRRMAPAVASCAAAPKSLPANAETGPSTTLPGAAGRAAAASNVHRKVTGATPAATGSGNASAAFSVV
ncbi:leucine-rich repeat and calponin homology domain-containing protein-like isoform X2 [Paramacrobiotus metropolitanus]|uniref:leucine-rich repeat and calponin homology domain-containing protein-like isoform X2 n=1 Tax=Paramacrobiotus metropolitanus TaxID=2943436 RepID=UPI002446369E|nr:leucine-rich repeat and calponin homology domain-containing protein-like isoform X2 [Paramacrobiotus metropolitanus]XP_055336829.1 leucine-rich repeat and calponin homology domain-containing protein-like isoform X2 [Paramacrobiotus metropolitanus]